MPGENLADNSRANYAREGSEEMRPLLLMAERIKRDEARLAKQRETYDKAVMDLVERRDRRDR